MLSSQVLSTVLASLCVFLSFNAVSAAGTENASFPYQSYKSANFTPPQLEISHAVAPAEGYIFFAPDGSTPVETAPLIMDVYGNLIWNGPAEHAFNFGVQTYKGEQVLVYWNGSVFPEPVGRGNGVVYLLDSSYEQVAAITLPGDFLELTPGAKYPSNIDLHEIFITYNGTVLVTANNVTQTDLSSVGGPTDGWVVDCLVYEIDIATNDVLFRWSSLEHLDQLPLSLSLYPLGSEGFTGVNQSVAWGYFHINAVSPYDGGYLISSRYFCSAVAIADDGSVKWRLQGRDGGDFTLGNGTNFCYQHDIRAIPEQPSSNTSAITLHMHDNANCPIDNGTTPTSALSLSVDFASKQVSLIHRYRNDSDPIYSTAQGNYQPLEDGNIFVGHGYFPKLEEFSKSGKTLMTVQFGAGVGTLSYRAFKQHWIGCPKTTPSVVAEADGNGTAVYVSWNGATEVEAWSVFGGDSAGDLSYIKTVPKDGFETKIELETVDYVQVKPKVVQSRGRQHGRHGYETCGCEFNATSALVAVSS